MKKDFEVIIIGGSYAGLSAGMALGRASRNVLIIDEGKPCNSPTPHSHNFLTRDGETPAAISAIAKDQVLMYPTVRFLDGRAVKAKKYDDRFIVETDSGEEIHAKKILLATGIKDIMPDIKGFAACWGKTVIHCPYCHGYEVKGHKTAVLANGDASMHYTMLLRQWTNSLTLLTNGPAEFTVEEHAKLQQHNITVIETEIDNLKHNGGQLKEIVLADGNTHKFSVIYYRPEFAHHSDLASQLGCSFDNAGYITADDMQQTTVQGVYAAGDCSSMMRAIASAVATGNKAGAIINRDLSLADF